MMILKFYTLLLVSFFGLSTHVVASVAATAIPITSQYAQQSTISQEAKTAEVVKIKKGISVKKALKSLFYSDAEPSVGYDGMAVAGFVCSLVGLFVAGILLGVLGIVFSAIALNRIKRTGKRGRGLAIAGLIMGIVAIIGALIVISKTM